MIETKVAVPEHMGQQSNSCLAAAMTETLDALSYAVFFIDAGGYIVHSNKAGHMLLGAADVLNSEAGRLSTGDAQLDEELQEVFAGNGSNQGGGMVGLTIPITARHGTRHLVHVLPLASASGGSRATYEPTAAVIVNEAAIDALPQVIAKVFKLSPTELRVLLAIVELGGVPKVAVALGIAESTVKTHLAGLFKKTGSRRQADLIKLVAGFRKQLLR